MPPCDRAILASRPARSASPAASLAGMTTAYPVYRTPLFAVFLTVRQTGMSSAFMRTLDTARPPGTRLMYTFEPPSMPSPSTIPLGRASETLV
ncbi:hypothetical protein CENSYa_0754 [Cenarchaeum symbiosum A]|uniref:Uncharacterized protein n=1 Tax=Cenarchaeum symbiosum (strain A) TaxID=414004 RepID=A0RVM0_CENSY|nr:hypothetical protein CENSYa_0754 [Cenarchaeum symbiosum A]